MLVTISGVHDGEHWPAKGQEANVDEATAKDLISSGLAERVESKAKTTADKAPKPEKATARKAEKRG